MIKLLAGDPINLFPDGGFKGFGKLGLKDAEAITSPLIFTQFISSAIGLITVIAIIWFIFIILIGAIGYISSGGDKNAIESARKKISNGAIGLLITVLAIFIIRLIGTLIGIPNILNFPELFNIIAPIVESS